MSAVIGGGAIGGMISNAQQGFQPYPNSIMVPFMAMQSAEMAYKFGFLMQMGKNHADQVAKDKEDIKVWLKDDGKLLRQHLEHMTQNHITIFREAIPHYAGVQNDLVEQMVNIELKKASVAPELWAKMVQAILFGMAGLNPQEHGLKPEDWDNFKRWLLGQLSSYGTGDLVPPQPPKEPQPTPQPPKEREPEPQPIPQPPKEPEPEPKEPLVTLLFEYGVYGFRSISYGFSIVLSKMAKEQLTKTRSEHQSVLRNLFKQKSYYESIIKTKGNITKTTQSIQEVARAKTTIYYMNSYAVAYFNHFKQPYTK